MMSGIAENVVNDERQEFDEDNLLSQLDATRMLSLLARVSM